MVTTVVSQLRRRTVVTVALAVAVVVGVGALPAAGQEAASPSATLTGATVQVEAGETSTVEATYEFSVPEAGEGDNALTAVSGTLWRFPGHDVSDVTATVNGEEVSPEMSQNERYYDLSIPVSDVSDGDTLTVTLSYSVASSAGTIQAPIWTPSFQTAGTDRVIDMTVTLPDGNGVQGAAFPKVDARSDGGSTLSYSLLHMPGFVSLQYGSGGASLVTLDTLATLAGVVIILGFFGAWYRFNQRALARRGGERDVA
jgi:hypothetical protein